MPFAPNSAERRRAVADDLAPLFTAFSEPRRTAAPPAQPQTIEPARASFFRTASFGRVAALGLTGAVAFGLAIGGFIGHEVRDPVRVADAPEASRAHYPPPQPVAVEATAPIKLAALTAPAIATPSPVAGDDGDEAPHPALRSATLRRECAPGLRCNRQSVMAADRALRIAYRNAIRAGVPRGELLEMRDRWADLRASQYRRPGRLYASYSDLADDLDAMSRDARASGRY